MVEQADSKTSHADTRASYVGPISDPGLAMLREQVKNIMIPLLIRVFHIKLEVQQASSPPSRFYSKQPEEKVQELIDQLHKLDQDLQMMIGWCQSCRSQVQKVTTEVDQELKPRSQIHSVVSSNPSVQKSYTEAISSHQDTCNQTRTLPSTTEDDSAPSSLSHKPSWWDKILKYKQIKKVR